MNKQLKNIVFQLKIENLF